METLAALIARDGKLGSFEAAGWAMRLAKRLEVTHQQGLVHGNVSAYCLLVESANPLTRGILIDVPRVAEPTYRSPERATSGATSQEDDVWALGVTLFYAITGQMPFQGNSDAEVRQRTLVGPPRLARYGVTDMGLQSVFDQLFAKDLPRRTITIVALRSALERWMRDPRLGQLTELEDDDEDQPTMMMAAPSIGSQKQAQAQAAAPPPPPAARPGVAKQTLLGMGSPMAPPLPAAGRPAEPSAAPFVPPTPPAPPPAEPFQAANIPAPPPVSQPAAGGFAPFDGMSLPPAAAQGPVSLPSSVSRAAPTMMAIKPPAPQAPAPAPMSAQASGLSSSTIALLAAVWFVVTFGGAAIEYVLITRL